MTDADKQQILDFVAESFGGTWRPMGTGRLYHALKFQASDGRWAIVTFYEQDGEDGNKVWRVEFAYEVISPHPLVTLDGRVILDT
jgi:hypothetical protein